MQNISPEKQQRMLNEIDLRDQFAMSAMQGVLAKYLPNYGSGNLLEYADLAYDIADVMLKPDSSNRTEK